MDSVRPSKRNVALLIPGERGVALVSLTEKDVDSVSPT